MAPSFFGWFSDWLWQDVFDLINLNQIVQNAIDFLNKFQFLGTIMHLIGKTIFNNLRKCQQGRKRRTVVVGHVLAQDALRVRRRFTTVCGYLLKSVAGLKIQ
jgi:hypothetical protein